MEGPVSSMSRAWHTSAATAPRPICTFFAMGGCSKGERCPFSHELVQLAPQGVDVSAGFFISGNVANYKAAPPTATAAPTSPTSGRRTDEAGTASSTDGLSSLASPSSHSANTTSFMASARECVHGDSTVTVASWCTSATNSTSSVKSLNTAAAASPLRGDTTSPDAAAEVSNTRINANAAVPTHRIMQVQAPAVAPQVSQPHTHSRPVAKPQPPQQQQPMAPTRLSQQGQLHASSQPPPPQHPQHQQHHQQHQQQAAHPPPQPPQPRSVVNARLGLARRTDSPASAHEYAVPYTATASASAAVHNNHDGATASTIVASSRITGSAKYVPPRSSASECSTAGTAGRFSHGSANLGASAQPFIHHSHRSSTASPAPSTSMTSTAAYTRRDTDMPSTPPAAAPTAATAPPRYTASSTFIAAPTTDTTPRSNALSLPSVARDINCRALPRSEPSAHPTLEAPLPRSRELLLSAGAGAAEPHAHAPSKSLTTVTLPAAASATASPPQYETRAATTSALAAATAPPAPSRVMLPAPRSQQAQQQLRAQQQAVFQPLQHSEPPQLPLRQQQQQQQQQMPPPPPPPHVQQSQQQHVLMQHLPQPQSPLHHHPQQHQKPPHAAQPQSSQRPQTVYLVAQPQSVTPSGTPPQEGSLAAGHLPYGCSVAYAAAPSGGYSNAGATTILLSEQPSNSGHQTYTLLTSCDAPASMQSLSAGPNAPAKSTVHYAPPSSVLAHNAGAVPTESEAPRFILVKADGTFTILQTAFATHTNGPLLAMMHSH